MNAKRLLIIDDQQQQRATTTVVQVNFDSEELCIGPTSKRSYYRKKGAADKLSVASMLMETLIAVVGYAKYNCCVFGLSWTLELSEPKCCLNIKYINMTV